MKRLTNLDQLAAVLQSVRRQRSTVRGLDVATHEQALSILPLFAPLLDDVVEVDRRRIAEDALQTALLTPVVTRAVLEAALGRASLAFQQLPRTRYILVTPLSFDRPSGLSARRVGTWRIRFSRGFPKKFDRSHVRSDVLVKLGQPYQWRTHALVAGTARTEHEAVAHALEALDLLRGVWNLTINRGVLSAHGSDETLPLNEIRIGPLHTLHYPSGKSATPTWWFEHFPSDTRMHPQYAAQWADIEAHERVQLHALAHTALGREIRPLLVRYCRALDVRNHETSLLQLWGVLEDITNSSRQEETVRRVMFTLPDDPLVAQSLELLRERRNQIAHSGTAAENARWAASQMQRYVARLLTLAMQVSGRIESVEEFGQWLHQPRELSAARRRVLLAEMAYRFHTSRGVGNTLRDIRLRLRKKK